MKGKSFPKKAYAIHQQLKKLGLTFAIAESCTGGLLAKQFTDFSGSSQYFKGGAVVYSNQAKKNLLKVPIKPWQSAVTSQIAIQMAKRTKALFAVDLAVSTTGYMEPQPQWAKKFTGVCFVALASKKTRCKKKILYGTRRQNRLSASIVAIDMIQKELQDLRRSNK